MATKKKTTKKKASSAKAPQVSSSEEKASPTSSSDSEDAPRAVMKRMSEFPNLPKANRVGQLAMKAYSDAVGVLPPHAEYLEGCAEDVMRVEDTHTLHQYWASRARFATGLANLPWEQRAFALVYQRAVITELKRQGFLTNVR